MSIEEMLKFLGVRTQSRESIDLCYQMDLAAFSMMPADARADMAIYEDVYKNLLDELGYQKLDLNSKKRILNIISNYSFDEIDRDYRDLYFTGLERVLLRHNHFEMVGFQRIAASDHDGIAKDAYLYELRGDYSMAMKYYNMIGESERYDICMQKSAK
ncbi:MAG: hypothetical protein J5936_04005 [Acholeplasmatales bacterium]|nr:hypothetical protein [Acholeplasmatales bacterium]